MINVLVTTTYARSEGAAISTMLIPAANFYEAEQIADKINTEATNRWPRYGGFGQYAIIVGGHPPEETK
jgi:hypothetical protein